jgi:uncharacterized membrane protein
MRRLPRLGQIFLAGVLAALPLVATLLLFTWLIGWVVHLAGPGSAFGQILAWVGFGPWQSQWVRYLIGLAMLLALIFALGLLVEAGLQRGLGALVEGLIGRIPLVRNVYEVIERFVAMVSERDAGKTASLTPVWCHFGGPGGVAVLGLLATPDPILLGERRYCAVLVPTAPVPVGGGLLYVPSEWVQAAELSVEALTSIYVSMGVTSSQYLPKGLSAASRVP